MDSENEEAKTCRKIKRPRLTIDAINYAEQTDSPLQKL